MLVYWSFCKYTNSIGVCARTDNNFSRKNKNEPLAAGVNVWIDEIPEGGICVYTKREEHNSPITIIG